MSAGFSRQITLNFAKFNDLIPCSCLIDELQYTLFREFVPKLRKSQIKRKFQKQFSKLLLKSFSKEFGGGPIGALGGGDSSALSSIENNAKTISKREKIKLADSDNEDKHQQDANNEEKEIKVEEPDTSPFEIIPNLHLNNLKDHFEK